MFEGIVQSHGECGKSEIIHVGEVDDVHSLAEVLSCKVGSLPSSYLGLPLSAIFKFEAVWRDFRKG